MKLVQFGDIYVNPNHVLYVQDLEGSTLIRFSDGFSQVVQGLSPEEIFDSLRVEPNTYISYLDAD